MSKITIPIVPSAPAKSDAEVAADGNDRHLQMLEAMKKFSGNPRPKQKNLSEVVIHNVSRNTRVALILAPEWGPWIPPYNMARLAALARHAGYETQCYDLNIECYHHGDKNLWHHYSDWQWKGEAYFNGIHRDLEPYLLKRIDDIVAFGPDILGFSIYYTNNACTDWMVRELKRRLPNAKVWAGGPQATQLQLYDTSQIDHVVSGEGELIFLDLLDKHENGVEVKDKVLIHDKSIRIDLDSMPIPDYSDFKLDYYSMGAGISSEMSRGCVAKCQFCSETTFWRYRKRQAHRIADEVEFNYTNYNIETVWFIDSLVNGDLAELREFAQELTRRDIRVKWLGYARCDHRMDLEYLRDLKTSGCEILNFGIESGSQHVLDLMKKNVKREAIEQNLKDMAQLKFDSFTNWFVGFPGETQGDINETMTLLWRVRKTRVNGFSFGICNLNPDTPLSQNREDFGVSRGHWAGHWVSNDYSNTIIHRVVRYKSIFVVLNHMRLGVDLPEQHLRLDRPGVNTHYELEYDRANLIDMIPYDDFDYNIIKVKINPIADTLINEIWPLLRLLWKAMGPYKINIRFSPDIDLPEFGPGFYLNDGYSEYRASHEFEINANGEWKADFQYDLKARGPNGNPTVDGFSYAFRLDWQGTGSWGARPVSQQ